MTCPPVFWGRGADDRVIGESAIARTTAYLREHSSRVERVHQGLAHGIDAAEAGDVRDFLALHASGGVVVSDARVSGDRSENRPLGPIPS